MSPRSRRRSLRRDELAKTLYGEVVWARDTFEECLGRRRTTSRLAVRGETPRDPQALLQVARLVARQIADPGVALAELAPGTHVPEREAAEGLLAECAELEASLRAIEALEADEKHAISVREERIARFVPKPIREEAGLVSGMALEIRCRDGKVEIEPAPRKVRIAQEGRVFVAVPLEPSEPLTSESVRETQELIRARHAVD